MKKIAGFENYIIDMNANVVNNSTGITLTHSKHSNGYRTVALNNNGKWATRFVHRLMAQAFIPNPDNLPQVNHINGIKHDNRLENLEWCTSKQNAIHSFTLGREFTEKQRVASRVSGKLLASKYAGGNKKLVINSETGIFYESIDDAAKSLNMNAISLSQKLRGERKNKTPFIVLNAPRPEIK